MSLPFAASTPLRWEAGLSHAMNISVIGFDVTRGTEPVSSPFSQDRHPLSVCFDVVDHCRGREVVLWKRLPVFPVRRKQKVAAVRPLYEFRCVSVFQITPLCNQRGIICHVGYP